MQLRRSLQRLSGVEARALAKIRRQRAEIRPSVHLAVTDPAALAGYAGRAIQFRSRVTQGRVNLPADVPLAFDDDLATDYFVAAGWAFHVEGLPVMAFPRGTIEIDQNATHASTGRSVLGG